MKNKNKRKKTDQKPVIDKRDNIYLQPEKKETLAEIAAKFKQKIEENDYVWVNFNDTNPYRKLVLRSIAISQNLKFYERN